MNMWLTGGCEGAELARMVGSESSGYEWDVCSVNN